MVNIASDIHAIVAHVRDPEIPVLTIGDLGILRRVDIDGETVVVTITPTYSGCPALAVIEADIKAALHDCGVVEVDVRISYSPPWTTAWMSRDARDRLSAYGVAPPTDQCEGSTTMLALGVRCPQCGSTSTREWSRWGSTACQAQYICRSCQEPFDHFKNY
jgi:ring-1,2-phenylacetyl-CoA epoxidase subunit PaaD